MKHENFVGREKLIEEFEGKYLEFLEKPQDREKFYALTYYGLGGIGKSWLLDELKEKLKDLGDGKTRYVEISLKERTDCITLIKRLAEELFKKCKYKFPSFKLAYNCYIQKVSNNAAKIDFSRKGKKWLKVIPIIGSFFGDAAGLLSDALMIALEDKESFIKSNKELRKRIEAMDIDELYENLPAFFAEDIKGQVEKDKAPLVVFLDVYENLVSEVSSEGNPLSADKWLRGDKGILKEIPGIFWVIGGRESLKWEKYDKMWKEKMEQTEVPKFTFSESDEYLELVGFENPGLRKEIHELTDGNPFFLSLCKKQLDIIKGRGEEPEISMFGRNTEEMFDRLVQNMDDTTMRVCYLLSAIYRWNDDLVFKIISRFSETVYENVKKLSFIEDTGNGIYRTNRMFSEVMMESCPGKIRSDAANLLIDTYREDVRKMDFTSPDYAERISGLIRGAELMSDDRELVRTFYCENIKNILYRFIKETFYSIDFSVFEHFISFAGKNKDDLLYAEALKLRGVFLYYSGVYGEAKELLSKANELFEKLLGKDDKETLESANILYSILDSMEETEETEEAQSVVEKVKALEDTDDIFAIGTMSSNARKLESEGKIKEALECYKKAYLLSEKLMGENHPDTLAYLHNYAYTLHSNGDYNAALPLKKAALDKMLKWNPLHPNTLCAMFSLAMSLETLGDTDHAKELYEEMIKKGGEILGEDHPVVLSAKCSYVNILGKCKRFDEAMALIDYVIEKDKEVYGEDHRETLNALHNKSGLFYDMEKFEDAYDIQKDLLGKRLALGDAGRKEYLESLSIIAAIKSKAYKDATADSDQAEVVKQYVAFYGEDHPYTLDAMRVRGVILEDLELYDKAYKVLKRALTKYEKYYGTESPKTKNIAMGTTLMMLKGKELTISEKQKEYKRMLKKYKLDK
ncbi:MAG: tetratricopeptide repeat protein [Clostridia bacterium]|nr:tetratricopeptide repeat protein [Clostridia bacterium]